ncbi:MAG: choice-of-anchor B family protein [Bacteroidetes bacterium]|nr:choice-of-anchor B family protein [Bacteroidota bacterium]
MPRFFFLIILITAIFISHPVKAQVNGVTLIGHLDKPHGVSTPPYYFKYSACWGWVSPTGMEYALISVDSGTSIIDLNGDSLREAQFIPGPLSGAIWREMKTYKNYAYIVSEGGAGVQIVDLSGLPDTAVLVKNFIYAPLVPPDSGKSNTRSHTVTIADGYLYCNGSQTWIPGGATIFSLREDPTNPSYVGKYEPEYLHDIYVRNDTLYGAAIAVGGGLYIADVRDKANPVQLGKISYSQSGTHNAWASIDGHYAFTTDEVNALKKDMKVWALDSLPKSVMVTEYAGDPASIVHNVFGRGNYVYVAHYTAGMRVVDVHDPRNLVEVGYYDTYPGPSGGYNGCWGAYPYFPSGKWIGSDMQTGLYVCRFDGLKPRVRSRLLEPPDSSSTFSGQFRWTSAADQSEDPHYYELHLKGAAVDSIYTTRDTSFTPPPFVPGDGGGQFTWFVMIRDEFTEVSSVDTFHFAITPTAVVGEKTMPASFFLQQNYPNPFNPMTTIEFTLDKSSIVTLLVADVLGSEIKMLLKDEPLGSGRHEVMFDASDLPSGTYFYTITTPEIHVTKKMVLSR